jgi:hypothetical protein
MQHSPAFVHCALDVHMVMLPLAIDPSDPLESEPTEAGVAMLLD